jgi:predicted metal-binding membrane protein
MGAATSLERVLRQDRYTVLVAIAAVTALAWSYVLWIAAQMDMSGMDMSGMNMPGMMAPGIAPWSPADFLFMFAMWAVMMVGMMLPSVAPMVLLYARVGRSALEHGKPFAATSWFAAGYVLSWTGFALLATGAQWGLEQAAVLSPATMTIGHTLGGVILIAVGAYQFTPLKEACLSQCQAPLVFIQRHGGFQRDASGALRLGLEHGLYCIGCCWALMALLFVVGVMNILWIAAIAVFVLVEKLVPAHRILSRAAGAALMVGGAWMLLPAT